jgi:hypothetical protein
MRSVPGACVRSVRSLMTITGVPYKGHAHVRTLLRFHHSLTLSLFFLIRPPPSRFSQQRLVTVLHVVHQVPQPSWLPRQIAQMRRLPRLVPTITSSQSSRMMKRNARVGESPRPKRQTMHLQPTVTRDPLLPGRRRTFNPLLLPHSSGM